MTKMRTIGLETLLKEQLLIQHALRSEHPTIHLRFPQRVQISKEYFTQLARKLVSQHTRPGTDAPKEMSIFMYDDNTVYIPVGENMTFESPNGRLEITGRIRHAAYGRVGDIDEQVNKDLGYTDLASAIRAYSRKDMQENKHYADREAIHQTVKPEGFYTVMVIDTPKLTPATREPKRDAA